MKGEGERGGGLIYIEDWSCHSGQKEVLQIVCTHTNRKTNYWRGQIELEQSENLRLGDNLVYF